MFGSTILEVAIGLTFCYASLALITSTIQEAIASALRLRARSLLGGIKTMLNDPGFNQLALALYQHSLVNPHDDGKAANQAEVAHKPSYIEPEHFAIALIDSIQSVPGNVANLAQDIEKIADPQLRQLLGNAWERAGGNLHQFQDALEGWFDNAMERVSGAYKRRSQLISVLITLLLAVLLNIDSIHLFRTLWLHPTLAAQLGVTPPAIDQRALEALWVLPIGWQTIPPAFDGTLVVKIAGWLITASSAMFGAPFWFDLLQRLAQVRGTGSKPRT
jgi:hypothetical protein